MNNIASAIQEYVNRRSATPIEVSESDIVKGERKDLWFLNRGFDSVTSSHDRKFYDVETEADALNAFREDIAAAGVTNPDVTVAFGRVCASVNETGGVDVDIFTSFGYKIRDGVTAPMVFEGDEA